MHIIEITAQVLDNLNGNRRGKFNTAKSLKNEQIMEPLPTESEKGLKSYNLTGLSCLPKQKNPHHSLKDFNRMPNNTT